MTASFTLVLDTQPPANPVLALNYGAVVTGDPVVIVSLSSVSEDVQEMVVWGDVDPTADSTVQTTEADSTWTLYSPDKAIRLDATPGPKYVFARLRDDVCNETPIIEAQITLDLDTPVVSITTPPDRTRISKVAPCNNALFRWQSNKPFVAYEVRVVPSPGSPQGAGFPINTQGGSANTSGVGAFPEATPITTVVNGSDLEAASPGDTAKTIKVFVQDTDGVWSA